MEDQEAVNLAADWADISQGLRKDLGHQLHSQWIKPIQVGGIDKDSGTLDLFLPTEFSANWVKDRFADRLSLAWKIARSEVRDVRIQVHPGRRQVADLRLHSDGRRPANDGADTSMMAIGADTLGDTGFTSSVGLDPSLTFAAFITGEANVLAFNAAQRMGATEKPQFSPLYLKAATGQGKTHLLHAVGQHVSGAKKGAKVSYVSSEKFTNEYIAAIQENQLVKFRKKYRQTDVLLIDDIQFLAGKERIQEEFFHTFNALHEAHKQIVLTCDRPASEIQNLEHRLVSRFEWGLVTDLQPPDVETRLAILRNKVKTMGVEIPEDVLTFLANRIRTNIRRLEGALIRVASYAHLTGKELTNDVVENLLREILQEEGRHTITIEVIQKKVAEKFDLRMADMTSKRRPENIAFPRQIAMFLSRQLTEHSLSAIGEAFGGRDHGTVLHACRLVKDRMEIDANVRQTVHYLEKQLLR